MEDEKKNRKIISISFSCVQRAQRITLFNFFDCHFFFIQCSVFVFWMTLSCRLPHQFKSTAYHVLGKLYNIMEHNAATKKIHKKRRKIIWLGEYIKWSKQQHFSEALIMVIKLTYTIVTILSSYLYLIFCHRCTAIKSLLYSTSSDNHAVTDNHNYCSFFWIIYFINIVLLQILMFSIAW